MEETAMPEPTPNPAPSPETVNPLGLAGGPTTDKPPVPSPPAPVQSDSADDVPLGESGERALKAEREARSRAERSASDLQRQLDAINRANESAVETAQREAREAQEAAAKATADALRYRVAAKHSISEDDAELFLTGTDADTLERQAARLAERPGTATAGPRPDLSQGGRGTPPTGTPEQDFANFLGAQMGS